MHRHGVSPAATEGVAVCVQRAHRERAPTLTARRQAHPNPEDRPPALLHCRHHIRAHRRALALCQLTGKADASCPSAAPLTGAPGPGAVHRLHQLQHLCTPYRSHLRSLSRKHPRRYPRGRRISLVQVAHQVAAAMGQGVGKLHMAVGQSPKHQRVHPQLRDPQRHPAAHPLLLPPDQLLPEPPSLCRIIL